MSEPTSRSGLDIPEGSAKADDVGETQLVDTNAEDARNPVDSDQSKEQQKPAQQPAQQTAQQPAQQPTQQSSTSSTQSSTPQ